MPKTRFPRLFLRSIIYFFYLLFSKTKQPLRCNLLFGLIGHFGLLKGVNISFFHFLNMLHKERQGEKMLMFTMLATPFSNGSTSNKVPSVSHMFSTRCHTLPEHQPCDCPIDLQPIMFRHIYFGFLISKTRKYFKMLYLGYTLTFAFPLSFHLIFSFLHSRHVLY